jgi:hypothetical protein
MKTIASMAVNMNILNNLPNLEHKPSNVLKLSILLARSLKEGARLNEVRDKMYELTGKLSDHKFKYESALATTLTTLINNVALHHSQQDDANRPVGAPKSHVIKAHLKPKVVKAAEPPRHIHMCHLKAFLALVGNMNQRDHLLAANVPLQ